MAPIATADLSSPIESFPGIPPFPDTVPTAPLVRISLRKLVDGNHAEEERLWEACRNLGFFYLDMRMGDGGLVRVDGVEENNVDGDAVLREADGLFAFMKDLFELPMEEKQPFDLKEKGIYFG
jgi:isopenicillin N synthase-like dioxygenase